MMMSSRFGSQNLKLFMFKFQYKNGKKTKKRIKNYGLQNGAGFRDYKSGQEGLQIGAALGISNRGKKITNGGRDFNSGQRD